MTQAAPHVHLRLSKWVYAATLFLLLLTGPVHTQAQFLRLQIVIEEDFSITGVSFLNPGVLPVNFGWIQIPIHDRAAGRVTLAAAENINLIVSFNAPEVLVLDENNTVPLRLQAAYINDGGTDTRRAVNFNGNSAQFRLSRSGQLVDKMNPRYHRLETNVYFFGSMFTGDIRPGVYRGTLSVTVEYE
ncbi:MAG: hypothetical protein RG741_09115 [Bacteroidales bacterium]|nr:hypothetical protein [Bacteroidales bacterium]